MLASWRTRIALTALLAVACVEPTGPGEARLGQVRLRPVFAAGESEAELRVSVDSVRVRITRSGEDVPLVDTTTAYDRDASLGWMLDLAAEQEELPVLVELRDGGVVLYVADSSVLAEEGHIGEEEVHEVFVTYVGPARTMAVEVSPAGATLAAAGATVAMSAVARDRAGATIDGAVFAWASTTPGVATVDATGLVTAVADGTTEVSAMHDGISASVTVTVAIDVPPGVPTPVHSTIDATPSSVAADGESLSTITVRLIDGDGEPLTTSGGIVTLATDVGDLSSVTDNDDGTYTATISSATAGIATITGTLNGAVIADDARVEFTQVASTGRSTISAAPESVVADGAANATITVRLFDANGHALVASGGEVALQASVGTLSAVTDHGDGTYTATVSSPTVGIATISGTLNDAALADDARVEFTAPPPPPSVVTSIEVSPELVTLTALGATQQFTAVARDQFGEVMEGVTFAWGSSVTGVATIDATSGLATATGAGSTTITAAANDVSGTAEFAVIPVGVPTPVHSTIDAAPSSLPADGASIATITVRLIDGHGHPLTASGGSVALATDVGDLSSVTDNDDGTYTATITSATAGIATITGTLNGEPMQDDATVGFTIFVPPSVLTSIEVSPATFTLTALGATQQFTAVARDQFGAVMEGVAFAWSSLVTGVATIDVVTGIATAVTTGSATVVASAGTVTGEATLVVEQLASVARSTIDATPESVVADGEMSAIVTVRLFDANGHALAASGGSVALQSSLGDPSAAADHGDGTYTATIRSTTAGLAVITGTLDGAGIADDARVGFTEPPPPPVLTTIEVSPGDPTLTTLGATQQFTAVARDQFGAVMEGVAFDWTSSAPSVLSVHAASGLATGHANGNAQVRAVASGVTGEASVTVRQVATSVTVSIPCPAGDGAPTAPRCDALDAFGDQLEVVAVARDAGGNLITSPAITWSSTDASIASVDAFGIVTAVGNGTTAVSATVDGASAALDVTVRQVVTNIVITPETLSLPVGQQHQLVAVGYDANGAVVADAVFVWISVDATVVQVDQAGRVTAIAAGESQVKAFAGSTHTRATITVP